MNAAQTKLILEKFPSDKSVMLVAKHGVGKSSVVKQVAQENGWGFQDVRLSQCEVGDIKGLPYLDKENMQTVFLKPKWWPRDPNSKGILFFDELNRATKDVLQAVFEICLDRRLDGDPLPEGWRVVAAINGDDDYDVIELDPALLDRWFVIDFDPSPEEWVSWARKNGIHDAIVDFILQNKELLDPPVGNLEAGRIYPSRRSWAALNDTAKALNIIDNFDDAMLTQVCKGWVGAEIAATFPKFVSNEYSRLKASDVLDDFEKVREKVEHACSDIEVIAGLANSVINEVKKRNSAKLGEAQQKCLRDFFLVLPSDVAATVWTELLKHKAAKKFMTTWIDDQEVSDKIERIYCS